MPSDSKKVVMRFEEITKLMMKEMSVGIMKNGCRRMLSRAMVGKTTRELIRDRTRNSREKRQQRRGPAWRR